MSLSKSDVREFAGDPVRGGVSATFRLGRHDLDIRVSETVRQPVVRVVPLGNSEADLRDVREAEISQHGDRLLVRFPKGSAASRGNTMMIGGNAVINGVRYQGPVTVINGVVYSGQDAMSFGVRVEVVLPEGSSSDIESVSGSAAIDGRLNNLRFLTVSGDVQADEVRSVTGSTTSGSVELGSVSEDGSVGTVSGSVEVANYNGRDLSVNTTSGSIWVTAGSDARGDISLNTVSGSITTRNTRGRPGLRVRPSTVSGRVREN